MKDELQANVQRDFALAALRAGVRVDGRALDAARHVRITLGPAHGQAHVALGSTVALASATADPVAPYPDRPAEGTLSISVELSPAASEPAALEFAVHGAHPPADRAAMALRGNVERVIRDSRAIDTEALCILAGKKVWAVSVEVSIVDAAGNCADAAHLAAMAALLHARRSDVSISGTDIHIHPFSEREPLPLPVHHVPLTVTYALFGGSNDFPSDIAALDPCLAEELASDGIVTVALNTHGEVCGLHKAGGLPVDPKLVARCAAIAADRVIALTEQLNTALHDSSVKHHPLAAVRPVLVAPEPTAMVPKLPAKKPRATAADGGDADMMDAPFLGGASTWNAVPADDAPPPPPPPPPPTAAVPQVAPANGKRHGDADEMADDDIAASAFRSMEAKPAVRAAFPCAAAAKGSAGKGAPPRAAAVASGDDSESGADSDDDLLAAVVSRPRGGGARRSKPSGKR
jgi:exosome complex component RRP45